MKDTINHLEVEGLVMMPQNFYAESYMVGKDDDGEYSIMSYPSNKKVDDYEILGMLMDSDVLKWNVSKENFGDYTVQAFCEYFLTDEDQEYDGPQKTECVCNRCNSKTVVKEDGLDYPLYCYTCDENKYRFEVTGCLPPEKNNIDFLNHVSDANNVFFDIMLPDGTNEIIKVGASILTNDTGKAWLSVTSDIERRKIHYENILIGLWTEELELSARTKGDDAYVRVLNLEYDIELQIKVQMDQPGIIFNLIRKSASGDTTVIPVVRLGMDGFHPQGE